MKLARLVYIPGSRKDSEGYKLEIMSDGEWSFDMFVPCVERIGHPGRMDYVHFSILSEMCKLQSLGYTIQILPITEDGE